MSTARPLSQNQTLAFQPSPLAAFLSYLVPGLGQVIKGRIGKGILFFVCLYSLFFYGLYLGEGRNVYIQSLASSPQTDMLTVLRERAPFLGQFWIGAAAWPAIFQYMTYNPNQDANPLLGNFQRMPTEEELKTLLRNNDKAPDLGWMYTVIAGVLNILVIYDAYAGAAFGLGSQISKREKETKEAAKPGEDLPS